MPHDRILIAVDDSEPSQGAAEEAVTLAQSFDADLEVLYVLQTAEKPPWFDNPETKPGVDTKAGRALELATTAAEQHGYDRDLTTAVVRGETAPAILQYADDHDIDLIVLGTHGRKGIDRVLSGSVAENVVRGSSVPVVTVPA